MALPDSSHRVTSGLLLSLELPPSQACQLICLHLPTPIRAAVPAWLSCRFWECKVLKLAGEHPPCWAISLSEIAVIIPFVLSVSTW